MVVAAVPRIYMGDARKWYSSHSPLLPSGKQLLRFHIAKRGKKDLQSSFFPRFLLFRPPPSRTWRERQVSYGWLPYSSFLRRRNRFLASLEMTVQGKCQTKCTSHQPLAAVHFCSNFSKISVTRSTYGTPSFSNIGIASLPSRPVRMPMHFAPARRLPITSE